MQEEAWICSFGKGGVTGTVFKKLGDLIILHFQGANSATLRTNAIGKDLHLGTYEHVISVPPALHFTPSSMPL